MRIKMFNFIEVKYLIRTINLLGNNFLSQIIIKLKSSFIFKLN